MRIMVVMLCAWLAGCATSNPVSANGSANGHTEVALTNEPATPPATTQNENSDEICLRSEMYQVEMCYERGDARVDPEFGRVVGHEMKLTHINANAK